MKYKFCSIRINVTKYEVAFATGGGGSTPPPRGYATELANWLKPTSLAKTD